MRFLQHAIVSATLLVTIAGVGAQDVRSVQLPDQFAQVVLRVEGMT